MKKLRSFYCSTSYLKNVNTKILPIVWYSVRLDLSPSARNTERVREQGAEKNILTYNEVTGG
jgi:hypothetical protein